MGTRSHASPTGEPRDGRGGWRGSRRKPRRDSKQAGVTPGSNPGLRSVPARISDNNDEASPRAYTGAAAGVARRTVTRRRPRSAANRIRPLYPGGSEYMPHLLPVERFGKKVVAAEIQHLSPERGIGESRSDDQKGLLRRGRDPIEYFDPVSVRQFALAEDDVELSGIHKAAASRHVRTRSGGTTTHRGSGTARSGRPLPG